MRWLVSLFPLCLLSVLMACGSKKATVTEQHTQFRSVYLANDSQLRQVLSSAEDELQLCESLYIFLPDSAGTWSPMSDDPTAKIVRHLSKRHKYTHKDSATATNKKTHGVYNVGDRINADYKIPVRDYSIGLSIYHILIFLLIMIVLGSILRKVI